MKRINKLTNQKTLADLTDYCYTKLKPRATSDFSNYAPNRKRLWLFHEIDLKTSELSLGYFDERLWNFCQRLYPGCNIGLFSFGTSSGKDGLIKWHRDHTYAQPIARTLNLGKCTFGLDMNRQSGNRQLFSLEHGELIEFNCKHSHALLEIHSQIRFGINLWKLNTNKGFLPLF